MAEEQLDNFKKELTDLITENAVLIEKIKNSVQALVDLSSNWGKNWIGKMGNRFL